MIKITKTNFGDYIGYYLHDKDGNPYDLSGCTAKIFYRYEGVLALEKDLLIESPPTLGFVKFLLLTTDFVNIGEYKGEIVIYKNTVLKKSFGGKIDDSIVLDVVETYEE
jgi:hypothetical protein